MNEIKEKAEKAGIRSHREKISMLRFAYVIAVVAGDEEDLKRTLVKLERFMKIYHLNINKKKIMVYGRRGDGNTNIRLGGQKIEEFCYLEREPAALVEARGIHIVSRIAQAKNALFIKKNLLSSRK